MSEVVKFPGTEHNDEVIPSSVILEYLDHAYAVIKANEARVVGLGIVVAYDNGGTEVSFSDTFHPHQVIGGAVELQGKILEFVLDAKEARRGS